MLNRIKNNSIEYLLILVLVGFGIFTSIESCSRKRTNNQYKKEMITKDSLRETERGSYAKLINDLQSKRDLKKELQKTDPELAKELKRLRREIKSITRVVTKPKDTTTRSIAKMDSSTNTTTFDSYYPSKEKPFVTYSGTIKDTNVTGEWKFDTLGLNLTVYERLKGVYEVDFKAPPWLTVSNIDVKSLPMEAQRPDKFDFVVGADFLTTYPNFSPNIGGSFGVRVKKTIVTIKVNSNKEVGISGYKLF